MRYLVKKKSSFTGFQLLLTIGFGAMVTTQIAQLATERSRLQMVLRTSVAVRAWLYTLTKNPTIRCAQVDVVTMSKPMLAALLVVAFTNTTSLTTLFHWNHGMMPQAGFCLINHRHRHQAPRL